MKPDDFDGVRYLPGELDAIAMVRALGAAYGYGNLISHLKAAWSERLQQKEGFTPLQGDRAASLICVWCNTDTRTGKKVKKAQR